MAAKPRNTAILEHREHIEKRKHDIASYVNNLKEGFKKPKETRHLLEQVELKFEKDARFMTDQEVDQLAARLIRETELHLIEEAKKTEDEEKKETEEGSHDPHKKKLMGEVKEVPIDQKGIVVEQTQENTTVKTPKSSITRGGFGKTAATAASGETLKLAGTPTERQKLDQRVKNLTNQARTNPQISRGHSLMRRFVPANLFASIARTRRLRKIKKELKAGYKGQVKRDAQKEVIAMNKASGLKGSLQSFRETIKANQEIDRRAAEQGRKEVEAINTKHEEIAAAVAAAGVTKRLDGMRREVANASPEEQEAWLEEPGYYSEASDRPALGNPRADGDGRDNYSNNASPSNYASSANDDEDDENDDGSGDQNDDDNNNNRRPRRRPNRKMLSKLKRGGSSTRDAVKAVKIIIQVARAIPWPVWVAIIAGVVILIIIALLMVLFADDAEKRAQQQQACQGVQESLSVVKAGPTTATNGQTLEYTFTIKDTVPFQELTIVDRLPETGIDLNPVEIRSSWPNFTYDPDQRTITWKASQNVPPGTLNDIKPFTLTLRANATSAHLLYVINSTPTRAGGGAGGKPAIALDPGHGGEVPEYTDSVTGLGDRETTNTPEREDVQDVANRVKGLLEPAGYSVVLLKQGATDVVSKRDRVNAAIAANAKVAVSIHTTADANDGFNQVWPQYVGGFRALQNDSVRVEFTNQQIAAESDRIAGIMAQQRTQTEGHAVSKTTDQTLSFGKARGLPSYGNISLVQLWATNIPWVYNEISQDNGTAISEGRKQAYAEGIANGIKQAIPATAGTPGGTPGCGTGGVPGAAPNLGAADFESLVKGQGRNTGILGDENAFVNALLRNGAKHFTGKEVQLRALYKAAIAKNVNPLIMATIWGVEAGFRVNDTEFGCKPFRSGFTAQVACSANTLDKHMSYFEQQTQSPVPHPVAPQCTFTDAFVYAYERYTPVCAISDSNGPARTNFVKYFKELYGTPTQP